jgi:hypothetical protein
LKSGDEIKSLVQEVDAEYVKYKKFDNQAGPIYNVAVSQIFMINPHCSPHQQKGIKRR